MQASKTRQDPATLRTIDLDPVDWYRATWRNLPPLPRPAPAPFDLQEALARLRKVGTRSNGWHWDWTRAKIAPSLSYDEASFWLLAMTCAKRLVTPSELATTLGVEGLSLHHTIDLPQVRKALTRLDTTLAPEIILLLAQVLPRADLYDFLVRESLRPGSNNYYNTDTTQPLLAGCRRYVLPYLTAEDLALLRACIRQADTFRAEAVKPYQHPPAAWLFAACAGMHAELLALVQRWDMAAKTSRMGYTPYDWAQDLVFGLGSAELVESHFRQLRLTLRRPEHIHAWLAHTEFAALDVARDGVLAVRHGQEARQMLQALGRAQAPEVAPFMVELLHSLRQPTPARVWLEAHPAHAIAGLLPLATGCGPLAEPARRTLRSLGYRGHTPMLQAALDSLPLHAAMPLRAVLFETLSCRDAEFDAQTTPDWLRMPLSSIPARDLSRVPAWVCAPDLPPIPVGRQRLSAAHIDTLLVTLRKSTLATPHPLVREVKAHADPSALDTFAWQLFQHWLAEGAPPGEKWALQAIGLLGGEPSVLKLTALIRDWPGQGQHARAVLGMHCLRAIGSDSALLQINGLAQRRTFKGLQAKARACIEQIAADRGLSQAQLEDRIIPHCDLDANGSRVFDFGAHRFQLLLSPELKPMLRNEANAILSTLPKPLARDDPALVAQAMTEWKLLKKQVATVAKIQAKRLEKAMAAGRRWSVQEFESLLLHHPLMGLLVRRLVWAAYAADGQLHATFRVTEDGSYADIDDRTWSIEHSAAVGVVHPVQLTEAQRNAWGEVLGDYSIVSLYKQLGRSVWRLEPEEVGRTAITRFAALPVPAATLIFPLEAMGWLPAAFGERGLHGGYLKHFALAQVTAVLRISAAQIGYQYEDETRCVECCFFLPGLISSPLQEQPRGALQLQEVDPLVLSETLRDLRIATAKGERA